MPDNFDLFQFDEDIIAPTSPTKPTNQLTNY